MSREVQDTPLMAFIQDCSPMDPADLPIDPAFPTPPIPQLAEDQGVKTCASRRPMCGATVPTGQNCHRGCPIPGRRPEENSVLEDTSGTTPFHRAPLPSAYTPSRRVDQDPRLPMPQLRRTLPSGPRLPQRVSHPRPAARDDFRGFAMPKLRCRLPHGPELPESVCHPWEAARDDCGVSGGIWDVWRVVLVRHVPVI